jgi:hypothetical protein
MKIIISGTFIKILDSLNVLYSSEQIRKRAVVAVAAVVALTALHRCPVFLKKRLA